MASQKAKWNLTHDKRRTIYKELLMSSDDGKKRHGTLKAAAAKFEVSRHTVKRIWEREQSSVATGDVSPNVRVREEGNSGRKGCEPEELQNAVSAAQPHKTRTSCYLEVSTGVYIYP